MVGIKEGGRIEMKMVWMTLCALLDVIRYVIAARVVGIKEGERIVMKMIWMDDSVKH